MNPALQAWAKEQLDAIHAAHQEDIALIQRVFATVEAAGLQSWQVALGGPSAGARPNQFGQLGNRWFHFGNDWQLSHQAFEANSRLNRIATKIKVTFESVGVKNISCEFDNELGSMRVRGVMPMPTTQVEPSLELEPYEPPRPRY